MLSTAVGIALLVARKGLKIYLLLPYLTVSPFRLADAFAIAIPLGV